MSPQYSASLWRKLKGKTEIRSETPAWGLSFIVFFQPETLRAIFKLKFEDQFCDVWLHQQTKRYWWESLMEENRNVESHGTTIDLKMPTSKTLKYA